MRHFLCMLVALGVAVPVKAEIMDTSGSLRAGDVSLGAEFQAGFVSTTTTMLNLHQRIGLSGGLDLVAREGIGLGDNPSYIGAGLKWTARSSGRNRIGVALFFGGHAILGGGPWAGDCTLLVDIPVGRLTPYLGADLNINFNDSNVNTQFGLLGGAKVVLASNLGWFVEGGLGLTGTPKPHFLSTGPRFNF